MRKHLLLLLLLAVGGWLPAHAQFGRFIWNKAIGSGLYLEQGYQMLKLRHGDYLLAGTQGLSPCLVRVDQQGDTVWARTYTSLSIGFADLAATSLAENRSGQVLVACNRSYTTGTGITDALLLLVNSSDGSIVWSQPYHTPADDIFGSVQRANDGNFVLLATVLGMRNVVWKMDSTGAVIWTSHVPYDSLQSGGSSVVLPVSGGYVIQNGIIDSRYNPPVVGSLVFIDEAGQLLLRKPPVPRTGFARRVLRDLNNDLVFPGTYLVKFTPQGDTLWMWTQPHRVGGTEIGVHAIASTPAGNYIALGERYSFNQNDLILLQIARNGQVLRDTVLTRPTSNEFALDIAVDAQGNYILFSYTNRGWLGTGTTPDMLLLKLRPWPDPVGVSAAAAAPTTSYLYPNPATEEVWLATAEPVSGHLTLRDLTGRIVRRHLLPIPTRTPRLPLTGHPPGLYVLTLEPPMGHAPRTWRLVKQ